VRRVREGSRRHWWVAGGVAVIVALVAGTWWLLTRHTRGAEIATVLALPVAILSLGAAAIAVVMALRMGRAEGKTLLNAAQDLAGAVRAQVGSGELIRAKAEDLQASRESEVRAHFEPRARGVLPFGTLSGWYFCGRVQALSEIVTWLSDPGRSDTRVRVVTGGPGSGKSAVLGRLVVMSHPELRSRVPPAEIARAPAGTVCPLGAISGRIHTRGRTVNEVAAAVAREVGIEAHDSDSLLVSREP
jgi:hypothetical protein